MRLSPTIGSLALLALSLVPLTVHAQTDPLQAQRQHLRRALEIANLDARIYLRVDYPRELRRLDSAIRLTQAEVDAVRRRLRSYGPYSMFDTGQPFQLSIEDDKLCLLDAELRLRNLREERWCLVRYHSDHLRLLELKAQEIREQLVQLEGGGEIAMISSRPVDADKNSPAKADR